MFHRYKLHELYLLTYSGDVLLPMFFEKTGLSDPEKLSWACVMMGLGLVFLTFEASLAFSSAAEDKGYNIFTPRAMATRAAGLGGRLFGAHCNAGEDLSSFGLAIACASALKADPTYVAKLAVLHVVYRALHWVAYASNVVAVRALVYTMGLQTTAFIFSKAIFDHTI